MALIQAFIDSPEILILDEPMNALDEKSVAVTQDLILKQKQKGLVVLSSHLASDIDNLCDVVYRIQEGKVV